MKNSELLIIGNIENKMRKIIKKFKLNKNIIFKNSVKQQELKNITHIQIYSLLAQLKKVYLWCNFKLWLVDYQLYVLKNSGGEEIIKDGIDGYILPIRDLDELKRKNIYLYENKSVCNQMGKMAQKKLRMLFHGKDMVKMLFRLTINY